MEAPDAEKMGIKMEVDAGMQKQILEKTKPLIIAMSTALLVAGVGAILLHVGVNIKSSTMKGDSNIAPTEDKTVASKLEVAAKDTDASLAKDEVKAKSGDLSAVNTDAMATTGEATALESGATAARTKAGAADIETKALKMT